MLSNRMGDYIYVSQGKTRIPGVNDAEEMLITDVSELLWDALLRALELAAASGPHQGRISTNHFKKNLIFKIHF